MIRHLPAILFIIGTLAVYAFYVMFAVAGVVLAINYVLELLPPVACPDHRGRAIG
jgi:hypothetical protein